MYHPSETGKARRIFTKCASVPTCALLNLYCSFGDAAGDT